MKQRRVDDVRVADHPADIGRRPPHLARRDAVEVLHRPLQRDHVAAIVAHHALGPAGGARRIENVERIGRRDRHAVERRAGVDQRVIAHRRPVAVAAFDQFCFRLRALQDQAGIGLVLGEIDRLVEQRLVGDDASGLEAAACREDDLRLGVVDTGGELARGKTAEHHRVDGADARAGEHREHRLRHHRHIENDPVALLHAEIAQHAAEHLGLGQQAVIGDGAFLPGERRVVDDRRLLAAPGIDMAVDRVEAGVADAADEPAAVDAGRSDRTRFWAFRSSRWRPPPRPKSLADRAASARRPRDSGSNGRPWASSRCCNYIALVRQSEMASSEWGKVICNSPLAIRNSETFR